MKIANIRLGFATNSSSSHSVVLLPVGANPREEWDGDYGFGWGDFLLRHHSAKMSYLAATMWPTLHEHYGEEVARLIIREITGDALPDDIGLWDAYVDHQSELAVPLDAATKQVSLDFLRDLREVLLNPRVAILGGNDNSEDPPHLAKWRGYDIGRDWPTQHGSFVARQAGDWWVFFNSATGGKFRFSFLEDPKPLWRDTVPQLVDLKITDACPFGCEFCYQGSTVSGSVAGLEDIERYLKSLGEAGVFEVAIGGGEPTLYPYFAEVLRSAHEAGIVPNFTTFIRPNKWPGHVREAVLEYAGGFALSTDGNEQDVIAVEDFSRLYGKRGALQFVVGAHYEYALAHLLKSARKASLPVTLLGYKTTGRGADVKPKKQTVTADVLRSGWRVSVDTAFVQQYPDVVAELDPHDLLVIEGEGRFSMYIDAVTQQAGISSYQPETFIQYKPHDDLVKVWKQLGAFVPKT